MSIVQIGKPRRYTPEEVAILRHSKEMLEHDQYTHEERRRRRQSGNQQSPGHRLSRFLALALLCIVGAVCLRSCGGQVAAQPKPSFITDTRQ
jgi:hypothetical protein